MQKCSIGLTGFSYPKLLRIAILIGRYLDSMIGKLPEDEQRYKDRSPLNHTANIKGAIGFFQGLK